MKIKNLFLIAILYSLTEIGYSQEVEKSKIYEVRNSIPVYLCDINGNLISQGDTMPHIPPIGAKFILVRPLNPTHEKFIIRYLKWTDEKDSALRKFYNDPLDISEWDSGRQMNWSSKDSSGNIRTHGRDSAGTWNNDSVNTGKRDREDLQNKKDSHKISDPNENWENKVDRFFIIQKYDLDSNCIKVYNSGIRSTTFTIGLVTMPLKLRLGTNFDFQGNLSLGSTAGAKIRVSKYNLNYINILLGTSISTVSLDSFSTGGRLTGQPLTSIAVFSPSLGIVFEFGKAQAGIFLGVDYLNKSTQTKYEWIYNKKPWLSIGFGFSILNIDSKSNNAGTDDQ
jgi:hypothetical protein